MYLWQLFHGFSLQVLVAALLHCGLSASIRKPVGRWNFDEHLKVESFLLFLNRLKVEE
jgi:hypothetical protein